jgi:hypothetical protein
MLDSSTPVLILGSNKNSLSVIRHWRGLEITVRLSGPPNCSGWAKIAATASHVFPLLLISDLMPTLGTTLTVLHQVTVK